MKTNGKENLLHLALSLLSDEGYSALTIGRLAEEAGITKATVYHYFQSKDEILEEIYRGGHRRLMKSGFHIDLSGSAEEVLLSLSRHWKEIFSDEENLRFLRLVFSEHLVEERAEEEYRTLSNMFRAQAGPVVESAARGKGHTLILTELFSSLLLTRLEKVLEEEDVDLEKDALEFSSLLEDLK